MDFGSQLQIQTMPSYGKIPGLPTNPAHNGLEGHVTKTEGAGGKSFGETIGVLLNRANDTMAQPEKLSIEAVQTGNVDIHEVMIALGKSEVAFKLITSVYRYKLGKNN
jgi:flagellar hook-basal body complex protein FliE